MIGAKHFALLVLVVSIAFAPSILQQADAQNVPPTGSGTAFHSNPAPGEKVTLEGMGTDANGDTLTYTWTLDAAPDGNMATIMNADQQIAMFTPVLEGSYTFILRILDGTTFFDSNVFIIVDNAPASPTVTLPNSGTVDDGRIQFTGTGELSRIIRVDWTSEDGRSNSFEPSFMPSGVPGGTIYNHLQNFPDGIYTFKHFQVDGIGRDSAPVERIVEIITTNKKTSFNIAPFGQIGPTQTEILALNLVGEGELPLATDPGNLLGDSIDGFGHVDSRVEIALASCAQSTGDFSLFDLLGRGGPTEISSGEEFFLDYLYDVSFDLTITDIDTRPGRDYATGLGTSFQHTCVNPTELSQSSDSIFAATGLPNLGSSLQLSSLHFFPFNTIDLGVDVNGDLVVDSLDLGFNTMSLTDPQQVQTNGDLVTDYEASLPLLGDVNPPFNIPMSGILQLSVQVLVPVGTTTPDADSDGVEDSSDNCVNTPNTGQGNLDADTLGDACDPNTEPTTNKFLTVDTTLGGDLTVDGTSFTIPFGITVEFDFVNNKIIIKNPGGKILIQGTIT